MSSRSLRLAEARTQNPIVGCHSHSIARQGVDLIVVRRAYPEMPSRQQAHQDDFNEYPHTVFLDQQALLWYLSRFLKLRYIVVAGSHVLSSFLKTALCLSHHPYVSL